MNQVYRFSLWIVLATLLFLGAVKLGQTKILFEDDFSSGKLDRYEFSWADKKAKDIAKNAKIAKSDPPKHGPNVLSLEEEPHAGNLLAMIKDVVFEDGYIELLWIDAGLPEDADGPLFFRGDIGQKEVSKIYDNSVLVELDTDTGLHFDFLNGGGVCEGCKGKLKSTPEWTWIKVKAEGAKMSLKAWLDGEKEPDWQIKVENKQYKKGAVGFRAWSGIVECAYIKITDLDGDAGGGQAVEAANKSAITWGKIKQSY